MPHLGKDPITGHLVKADSGHLAFDCPGDFCIDESPLVRSSFTEGSVSDGFIGTVFDRTYSISGGQDLYFKFSARGDFSLKIYLGGAVKYTSANLFGETLFPPPTFLPFHIKATRFGKFEISSSTTLRIEVQANSFFPLAGFSRAWDFRVNCGCQDFDYTTTFLSRSFGQDGEGFAGINNWFAPWEHSVDTEYEVRTDVLLDPTETGSTTISAIVVMFDSGTHTGLFPGSTANDFTSMVTPGPTVTMTFVQDFIYSGSTPFLAQGNYLYMRCIGPVSSSSSSSSTSFSSSSVSISSSSSSSSVTI